jgi:predicted nucleic acid-binding protein
VIAYDTDVLVELLKGHPTYAAKARAIPKETQFVPIVVVEEIQRGRLNSIRQAEAGKGGISLVRAYELYEQSLSMDHSSRTSYIQTTSTAISCVTSGRGSLPNSSRS